MVPETLKTELGKYRPNLVNQYNWNLSTLLVSPSPPTQPPTSVTNGHPNGSENGHGNGHLTRKLSRKAPRYSQPLNITFLQNVDVTRDECLIIYKPPVPSIEAMKCLNGMKGEVPVVLNGNLEQRRKITTAVCGFVFYLF